LARRRRGVAGAGSSRSSDSAMPRAFSAAAAIFTDEGADAQKRS
jgi:hypothetical protein